MPFNDGDLFAGYHIVRLLGSGGMGEVYLAQHPRLPRLDALKILSNDTTGDGVFRARFTREAELAATLWHPHIVGVHDRGEFNGRLWISMDYVDGTDARHLLEQRHPSGMPHQDVVEIVTAVAEALDFAHERRLLHRDVKPANILVTTPSDGARRRVLLTDFGIARETDDTSGLTEANMAIGTVTYAAPEQLTSRSIDGRADQYALAATAFHLLTGSPPFHHRNRVVVVGDHLYTPPPRLSERRADLAHLDAVMAKALSKDPADRYASCLDFAKALDRRPDVKTEPEAEPAPAPARDVHTAPLDITADRPAGTPAHTKRLDRMTVLGTVRAVQKRPAGPGSDEEVWSLQVEYHDATGDANTVVHVELRDSAIAGQLCAGDVVEASGFWDDRILFADTVVNHSVGRRAHHESTSSGVKPLRRPVWRSPKALIVALVAVIAVIAGVAIVVTGDFGSGSDSGPGPVVTPARATVFAPVGTPDHAAQAALAIDGDPDTSWPTDTYQDATPFPTFKEGVGLVLHLSEPTALSEVTIEVPSTGTEVQIRAADSATPTSLSDTTELTSSVRLQPGANTIPIDNHTETSDVVVWITRLGTTDGQSRTDISDITLRAAP